MQVKSMRFAVNTAVASVFVGLALTASAVAMPDSPSSTVTGVAVDYARDVNAVAHTPVEYSAPGQGSRVELVPVRAAKGDVVEVALDETGMPVYDWSLYEKLALTALLLAVSGLIAAIVIVLLVDPELEEREWRARRREHGDANFMWYA